MDKLDCPKDSLEPGTELLRIVVEYSHIHHATSSVAPPHVGGALFSIRSHSPPTLPATSPYSATACRARSGTWCGSPDRAIPCDRRSLPSPYVPHSPPTPRRRRCVR